VSNPSPDNTERPPDRGRVRCADPYPAQGVVNRVGGPFGDRGEHAPETTAHTDTNRTAKNLRGSGTDSSTSSKPPSPVFTAPAAHLPAPAVGRIAL
jgi:hypothetical protein